MVSNIMKQKYFVIVENFCDVIELDEEFDSIFEAEGYIADELDHLTHGEPYICVSIEGLKRIAQQIKDTDA